MDAVGIIQGRCIWFRPFVLLWGFVTNKVMNSTIETTAFKVVDYRGQGFCPDVKLSKAIEGNLSPGHGHKIFDDLFGDNRCLSNSPAANEYFMRTVGKLDGHLRIV